MFKQTLLFSAMALTLTACGPESNIRNDFEQDSNTPNTETNATIVNSDSANSGDNTDTPSDHTPDSTDNSGSSDNKDTTESSNAESASAFVNGNHYNDGERVENDGSVYQCKISGWCSLGADAYIPGEGFGWEDAWTLIGDGVASEDNGNSNTDETTDTTENPGATGTDNADQTNGGSDTETDAGAETGTGNSDGNYTTNLDMTGWPQPLKEKNVAYTNTNDKVVGTYFVEWGVYGRGYHVADIPAQNLTHVLYGFIPICGPNASLQAAGGSAYSALQQQCADKQDYEVVIHDEWAALGIAYPGDTWDQPVKGNFGQLIRMKASNPDIKVLPSIGGWTLSDPFFELGIADNRATFVASVKDFLLTWDFFDGVDIDWEFPGGGGANATLGQASDAQTYVLLMRDLRTMLDEVEAETGRQMELTSAIGTSPRFIQAVDYANASPYMDYIFMMTYDYKGAWSSELGHQTNLYNSQITADGSLSIDTAVNEMIKQNVDPAKLVVGVAKYGRGWTNVSGVTGNNPFAGTGGGALNESGYWEAGIMDYKLIEERYLGGNANGAGSNGWQHLYDETAQASYLWNSGEQKLISFDSARSVKAKGEYVTQHNLGGVFSWEIDADNGTLLNAMHEGLGHSLQ